MTDTGQDTSSITASSTTGGGEEQGKSRGPHRLNSETARAAAQKSAEVRKAKAAARRTAASGAVSSAQGALPDGTVGVVVPVQYVEVIRTLQRQTLGGDVSAARELRAWKNEHPQVDEHVELDEQPAIKRDRLLRLLEPVTEGKVSVDELLELVRQQQEIPAKTSSTDTTATEEETTESQSGEATPATTVPSRPGVPEAPQAHTHSEKDSAQDEQG